MRPPKLFGMGERKRRGRTYPLCSVVPGYPVEREPPPPVRVVEMEPVVVGVPVDVAIVVDLVDEVDTAAEEVEQEPVQGRH